MCPITWNPDHTSSGTTIKQKTLDFKQILLYGTEILHISCLLRAWTAHITISFLYCCIQIMHIGLYMIKSWGQNWKHKRSKFFELLIPLELKIMWYSFNPCIYVYMIFYIPLFLYSMRYIWYIWVFYLYIYFVLLLIGCTDRLDRRDRKFRAWVWSWVWRQMWRPQGIITSC